VERGAGFRLWGGVVEKTPPTFVYYTGVKLDEGAWWGGVR